MFRETPAARDNAVMKNLYRKILEIVLIFALGAAIAVASVIWIGSGIENENSQIAAAFLGLIGSAISGSSLIAMIVLLLGHNIRAHKEKKCQEHEDQ